MNKTIITYLITLAFPLIVSGCASPPTVYLYGKYLEPSKVQALSEQLTDQGLNVEVNDFDFPTSVSTNTLLYSLLLQSPEAIDNTTSITEHAGYSINRVQSLTQGNHWYTKNSLALFVFPDGNRPHGTLLAQDLIHSYIANGCGNGERLTLYKDGTYTLTLQTPTSSEDVKGKWKYRQFPYLELQEPNSPYANYYFEISRVESEDKVSKLDLTHLHLLNANSTNPLASECVFTYGVRI